MDSQWIIAFNASLAFFVGVIVGYTRKSNYRPAGIRTQAFICAGAAFLSGLSVHIGQDYAVTTADPARLMAQIVTGIGFLGGGVILKNTDKVKGVTTAAMIWYTAVLGIFLGASYYIPAFVGLFLVYVSELIAKLEFYFGLKSKPYMLAVSTKKASKVHHFFDAMDIDFHEERHNDQVVIHFDSSRFRNKKLTVFLEKQSINHSLQRLSSLTHKPLHG